MKPEYIGFLLSILMAFIPYKAQNRTPLMLYGINGVLLLKFPRNFTPQGHLREKDDLACYHLALFTYPDSLLFKKDISAILYYHYVTNVI
jgi:hypothetical protein